MYYIVRMEYSSGVRCHRSSSGPGYYYYWGWNDIAVEEICETKEEAEANMSNHGGMFKANYEIIELNQFDDSDYQLTFGKYKGELLKDVGILYLLWLYNKGIIVNDRIKTLLVKHGILKDDRLSEKYNAAIKRLINREEIEKRAWEEMLKSEEM